MWVLEVKKNDVHIPFDVPVARFVSYDVRYGSDDVNWD